MPPTRSTSTSNTPPPTTSSATSTPSSTTWYSSWFPCFDDDYEYNDSMEEAYVLPGDTFQVLDAEACPFSEDWYEYTLCAGCILNIFTLFHGTFDPYAAMALHSTASTVSVTTNKNNELSITYTAPPASEIGESEHVYLLIYHGRYIPVDYTATLSVTPVSLIVEGFTLVFQGNVPTNTGEQRRFSTAFDDEAIIASYSLGTGGTAGLCADTCLAVPECVGMFYWQLPTAERFCVLLSDLGTAEGDTTSSVSYSYRRDEEEHQSTTSSATSPTPTPTTTTTTTTVTYVTSWLPCAGDDYEPNDSFLEAYMLPGDTFQVLDAEACPFTLDWYEYMLCAGCTLDITIVFKERTGRSFIGIYSVSGHAPANAISDREYNITYTAPPASVTGESEHVYILISHGRFIPVNYTATVSVQNDDPTSLEGFELVFQGDVPTNEGQARRFSTAFDQSAIIDTLVAGPEDTSQDCADACLAVAECVGVFLWELESGERRCSLLNDVGTPAGTPTSTHSYSHRVQAAQDDPTSLEGFELVFQGDVPTNEGQARRFSTAFDQSAIIASYSGFGGTPQDCADICLEDPECVGVFLWELESGERRCYLLNDLGTPEGTPTSSYSYSHRVIGAGGDPRSLEGFTLVFQGNNPGNQGVARRFSTAFDEGAIIDRFSGGATAQPQDCGDACLAVAECVGVFLWELASGERRCYLLNDLGTPQGVVTSGNSYSHARDQTVTTPEGYALDYAGAVPGNTGSTLRFSTAFDVGARLQVVLNESPETCAAACDANQACAGIFYWIVHVGDVRCYLLSSLGTAAATSSASYSFRRVSTPAAYVPPAGYVVQHKGDTFDNAAGPKRRFTTAFDTSARIDTVNMAVRDDGQACAAQCNMTSACLGFYYWARASNLYTCYLLSDLGLPEGVVTSGNSYSVAKLGVSASVPGYELTFEGDTGTNSGELRRFSTAFDAGVRVASVPNADLVACASACDESTLCLGFFHWTKSASATECWLLSDLGTPQGIVTGTNSYSFAKLLP